MTVDAFPGPAGRFVREGLELKAFIGVETGGPLERSLFAPFYEKELNSEEREVAVYLDGEQALAWWHRNVARTQYGLQGWKKAKIYPDFIFAVQNKGKAKRITVLETKGDQLDNLDTAYNVEPLTFLFAIFRWDDYRPPVSWSWSRTMVRPSWGR
jgi:type III restriction enzyme